MADYLFRTHSGLRYVLLAAGAGALLLLLAQAMRKQPPGRAGRLSAIVFTAVLDHQFLVGLSLLLVFPYHSALTGHIVLMTVAVVLAHVLSVIHKRRPAGNRGGLLAVTTIAVPLSLIVAGMVVLG